MAAPSFVQASAGAVETTGTGHTHSLTSVTTGNVVIFHILTDGTTPSTVAFTSGGVENLAGTANAMTQIGGSESVGSPAAATHRLYIGRATATTVTATFSADTQDVYVRWYEFADVSAGTTLADVTENDASTYVNERATSNTIADTGVTTNGADRLACQFVAVNDDNALDAFTGMTGGTWAEAVAEYAVATGTDAAIGLQIAEMASAGTINGGTDTMAASDGWAVIGFALIGTTVTAVPRHGFVNLQDPGVLMSGLARRGRVLVPRLWTPEGATI